MNPEGRDISRPVTGGQGLPVLVHCRRSRSASGLGPFFELESHISGKMPVSSFPILENCEGCGACCRMMVVPPFRRDATIDEFQNKQIPQGLLNEILPDWEVRFLLPERPCSWFDENSGRCRHYELRPEACRDFAINSPSCLACREKFEIPDPRDHELPDAR